LTRKFVVISALIFAGCKSTPVVAPVPQPAPYEMSVIPLPTSAKVDASQRFVIDTLVTVAVDANADSTVGYVADYLNTMLGPIVRRPVARGGAADHAITLAIDPSATEGPEGYHLTISPASVRLTSSSAAGLFHGVQTIRQLLPWSVEHRAALGRRLWLPAG